MLSEPVIEIQSQVLRQALSVVGTPFTLNYRSDRVPGRHAAYSITIPLSTATVPSGLKAIELEVEVARRRFTKTFPPKPDQSHSFTWDSKDGGGNVVTRKQTAKVRVGYAYRASWPRPKLTRWQEWITALGIWDA